MKPRFTGRRPRRLPLPKVAAHDAPAREHWLLRWERERDEMAAVKAEGASTAHPLSAATRADHQD